MNQNLESQTAITKFAERYGIIPVRTRQNNVLMRSQLGTQKESL